MIILSEYYILAQNHPPMFTGDSSFYPSTQIRNFAVLYHTGRFLDPESQNFAIISFKNNSFSIVIKLLKPQRVFLAMLR